MNRACGLSEERAKSVHMLAWKHPTQAVELLRSLGTDEADALAGYIDQLTEARANTKRLRAELEASNNEWMRIEGILQKALGSP